MGFFKILKKVTRFIAAPIDIPFKAITGGKLIAPVTDLGIDLVALPVKAAIGAAKGITAPPKPTVIVPVPVFIPGPAPIVVQAPPRVAGPPPARISTPPIPIRPNVTGGAIAFGGFSPFQTSGGNPAWASLTQSQTLPGRSVVVSSTSSRRWAVSGNSVRLLE